MDLKQKYNLFRSTVKNYDGRLEEFQSSTYGLLHNIIRSVYYTQLSSDKKIERLTKILKKLFDNTGSIDGVKLRAYSKSF